MSAIEVLGIRLKTYERGILTKNDERRPCTITNPVFPIPLKYPSRQKATEMIRYSNEHPRRYSAVASITAWSSAKIDARFPPKKNVARNIATPKQKDIFWAMNRDWTARLGFPAPIFWATKAERADINAMGTMERNTYIFSDIPTLAEAVRPREFIMLVIIRNDMPTRKSWRAMGAPILTIELIVPGSLKLFW